MRGPQCSARPRPLGKDCLLSEVQPGLCDPGGGPNSSVSAAIVRAFTQLGQHWESIRSASHVDEHTSAISAKPPTTNWKNVFASGGLSDRRRDGVARGRFCDTCNVLSPRNGGGCGHIVVGHDADQRCRRIRHQLLCHVHVGDALLDVVEIPQHFKLMHMQAAC